MVFGLDLPLLSFPKNQNKLVVINENEQYSFKKLFDIGENQQVKHFLLQVCYAAIEKIGYEQFPFFDTRSNNYEKILAQLCVDLTQFSNSGNFDRHRVSIELEDLKSKAFYEECSIEYLDDKGSWSKVPAKDEINLSLGSKNGRIRAKITGTDSRCRIKMRVQAIYRHVEDEGRTLQGDP